MADETEVVWLVVIDGILPGEIWQTFEEFTDEAKARAYAADVLAPPEHLERRERGRYARRVVVYRATPVVEGSYQIDNI